MLEPNMTRRGFLIFSLAGTGGLAWLIARPETKGFINGDLNGTSTRKGATPRGASLRMVSSANNQVNYQPDLYLSRAKEMYATIKRLYEIDGKTMFVEYPDPKLNPGYGSRLWPYTTVLSAAGVLALASEEEADRQELQRLLEGLKAYDDGSIPLAYQSYLVEKGTAPRYYDDNEWIGQVLINAYRLLGDRRYLLGAINIFRWLATGWDDALGGGFYWFEKDYSTKNTCSNGPAAVLALQIYQATGQSEYLNWAQMTLKWLYRLKDPDTGIYWDHINRDGSIDRTFWTYNVGSVLQANALLYQITGTQEYLDEARSLAAASLEQFTNDRGDGKLFFPQTPWFNTILLRGYAALFQADPNHDPRYINLYIQNLDYAWEHARQKDGTICPDWSGSQPSPGSQRWILDQVAIIESYATISRLSS